MSDFQSAILTDRVDLLAGDVPIVSSNEFVCFNYKVPDGQVLVVKSMAFFAQERINVGAADESFRMLQPLDANGHFLFSPRINNINPFVMQSDVNAPRVAAGTLRNKDRAQPSGGISFISANPWQDVASSQADLNLAVHAGKSLKVLFSILTNGAASGLASTGLFTIGAAAVKRVDFAGAMVYGHQMPESQYAALKKKAK